MSDNVIIKTESLTKKYGDLTAVNALDLEIYEGEIFGLLGPNGAGKTTTILMLLGLTEPTEGSAWINGNNTTKDPIIVKKTVGYLPDNIGFYEDMTGRENLRFIGRLNEVDKDTMESKIDDLLTRVKLTEAADKKVGTYSRGMLQRLGIADMLMKDPKVIILDEPTLGLDPEGINEMLDLIVDLAKKDRRTVLISSHLLHQVQKICSRVCIFVKGNMLAVGEIDTLAQQLYKDQVLTLEMKISNFSSEISDLIKKLDDSLEIVKKNDLITLKSKNDIKKPLIKLLSENDSDLTYLRVSGRDLDDIYSRYFKGEGVN